MATKNNGYWTKGTGYWLGKKRPPFSEQWIRNLKLAKAKQKARDGYINSPTARKKLSKALKGKPKPEWMKVKMRGSNSSFWRGGRSSEIRIARERVDYKQWRLAILKRDNYTCQECHKRGGVLNVNHKIPFCVLPIHWRFDLDNGETLCVSCHRKTPTYGNGAKQLQEKLEKMYGNSQKSGLSKRSSRIFDW